MNHRRQVSVWVAVLLAVTSLPYLYAYVSTPPDLVYTGLMFDVPDHAQYWSWITASRKALFISNTMTPEANDALFVNPIMWALARTQVALGLSFPLLFQWWRVIAIVMLVPALLGFVRAMVSEPERRVTTFVIALLGSGFGWILIVAKKFLATADVPWPTDLYTVEPNTFWSMLAYPYISFAHALILTTMTGTWLVFRGRAWVYGLLAAAAAAALSVSHAYDLIAIYAVIGVFGLVVWIRHRRFPLRLAVVGFVIAASSAPAALYYQRLTSTDPLWRMILSQYSNAGVWTPPHLHLIVLMGAPLLLAILGVVRGSRWSEEQWFAATWAATGLCLIYLPVVYQIKLLSGWQFPIAILAAHAWHERIKPAFDAKMSPRWAFAALIVLVSSTNVYLFAWRFIDLGRHSAPYYLHRDEVAALGWLSRNTTPSDVVLGQVDIGQFVPNYGASRAYLAHWAMTNRFYERRANVDTFFAPATPDEWRRQLLTKEHVTLVVRTDWPDSVSTLYDPSQSQDFEQLFNRPHAQVYRLRVPQAATAANWPVGRE